MGESVHAKLLQEKMHDSKQFSGTLYFSRDGEIGRHARFKIWWRQLRAGSSPALGTIFFY